MSYRRTGLLVGLLALMAMIVGACSPRVVNEPVGQDHASEEHSNPDSDHADEHGARVPNEGAEIHILSPSEGDVITGGEVVVEVEVINFELDHDGSHWHVYVDGVSHGMVTGHDFDQALRGLEPGEHTIEVYLAHGTHEELEQGDSVTITIQE